MAQERPGQTAVDYVTIVLSPVLIMGLVGSLVFFLLEVFYKTDGQWKQRLQWILFFYVFGTVLVGRVSMNGETADRAPIYGTLLALLTYIGMQSFVEYPDGVRELSFLFNLFLVAIVWWCAYRLVWDCTNVDEDTDMSGEGLLQAAGLEETQQSNDNEVIEATIDDGKAPKKLSWLERYRRWREERDKKRTLGVWLIYFSLAALPLFGLGQSLIPLTAPDRRQFSFWLMTVYIGCGLGLMLTTCFLGLRRYLRQKRLQMPAAMTGMWLMSGCTLVLILLIIGALLPRPYPEYPVIGNLDPLGSKKRDANSFSAGGGAGGEGKGQPGEARPDGKNGPGQSGKDGKGSGKDREGKSGKGGEKSGSSKGEKGENSGGSQKDGKGNQDGKQGENKGEKDGGQKDSRSGSNTSTGQKDRGTKANDRQKQGNAPESSSRLQAMQQVIQRAAPILKWIVFAILAVLVFIAVLRGALGFLANFTDWAKRLLAAWQKFWANLFGQGQKNAETTEESEEEEEREPPVPFSAFRNPFESGEAEGMSPRELVRYTFRAVEAWARERDLPRGEHETAMEFLTRVGDEVPPMENAAKNLGLLHARAEYARGELPANTNQALQAAWEKLERVALAPMSA